MRAHRNLERDGGQDFLIVEAADGQAVDSVIRNRVGQQVSPGEDRIAGRLAKGLAALFGDVLILAVSGLILWRLLPGGIASPHFLTCWMAAIAGYVLLSAATSAVRPDPSSGLLFPGFDAAVIWLVSTAVTVALLHTAGLLEAANFGRLEMLCLPAGALGLLALRPLIRRVGTFLGAANGTAMRVAVAGRGPLLGTFSSALRVARGRGDVASVALVEMPEGADPSVDLTERLQAIMPDALVLAADKDDLPLLQAGAHAARSLPLDLLVPVAAASSGVKASVQYGDQPLVRLKRRPLGGLRGPAKRAEDVVIGLAALLVAMPVMMLVAASIRLGSRGPILIRQRRFGYGNRPIYIWKFRTMYWEQCDLSGAQATIRNDPRVTRLGRILRSTSLDELPQLFNVLSGDMALVGPRPHPIEMQVGGVYYYDAIPDYLARHRMKPGITGLAQINGARGLVDTIEKAQERLDYDLRYIDDWSISFDLIILVRTAYKGFLSRGSF